MRNRLTRQLCWILFIGVVFDAQAAAPVAAASGLSSSEQASYLAAVKHQYPALDERQALLKQCNQLLQTYALRVGYQVGQRQPHDLIYQLSLNGPGELLVREESRAPQGPEVSVHHRRVMVFGLDPYIHYECPLSGIRCVFKDPTDGSPLLSVVRDQEGAAALAKALSFLLRNLQKS